MPILSTPAVLRHGILLYAMAAIATGASIRVCAQDSADPRLPDSARLALRAKSGDVIKVEGDRKVTNHVHLEVLSSEFSTESNVKETANFQYRGKAPSGAMMFDVRGAATATTMVSGGPQAKPVVVRMAGTYTVKPSKEVIKAVPLATTPKRAQASANSVAGSGQGIFGPIRFPERALKAGDTWSGSIPVAENADLKGITMHYESTLVGFEMYQSFPCARVESNLSYKGTMPGIDAQIRKQVPAGSKLTSVGELTGTLTSYYVLDRGWAMNESAKINVILNISVTVNGRAIEFGGTIDTDQHSAVVGYPAYDAALVPKAGSASAR